MFAKEFIPRGIKVGPYEGTIVFKEDMDDIEDTSYMWEVRRMHDCGNKTNVLTNKLDGRDAQVQCACAVS